MKHQNLGLRAAAAALLAALAILGFIALPAIAATSVKVSLNIGGPGVVWQHRPPVVMVPGTQVSWIEEYSGADVYQYGSSWYCYRGGNWYRASGYRGPWAGMNESQVPHDIVYVPQRYHHFSRPVPMNQGRRGGPSPGLRRDYRVNPGNPGMHGNPGGPGRPGNSGKPGRSDQPGNSGHGSPGQNGGDPRH